MTAAYTTFGFNPQRTGHDPDAVGPKAAVSHAWQTHVGEFVASLVGTADTLYVSTMGGDLHALDPSDGTGEWVFETDGIGTTVSVRDGVAYWGSGPEVGSSTLYAIEDGSVRWEADTDWTLTDHVLLSRYLHYTETYSVEPERAGFDTFTEVLHTLETDDGTQSLPRTTIPDASGCMPGDVRLAADSGGSRRGRVYLVLLNGLYAIESGVEWSHEFDEVTGPGTIPPVVADGTVYLAVGGQVLAIDEATGATSWTADVPVGSLAVAEGWVYGVSSEQVVCLDGGDGSIRWSWTFDSPLPFPLEPQDVFDVTPPTVADGVVYFALGTAERGAVIGVEAADGKPLWQSQLEEVPRCPPVVLDGSVYVGTEAGAVYALEGSTTRLG